MQLVPQEQLNPQISDLKGKYFEHVVAASYSYIGYTVFRNIILYVEKQKVTEIDVVAYILTPFKEISLAVECKGATPKFNELRKFSSTRKILTPNPDQLIVFGDNDLRDEHNEFSKLLNIKLLKKEDLTKFVLPILWGYSDIRESRIKKLNRFLAVYEIQDYLTYNVLNEENNNEVKKEIRRYIRYLKGYFWNLEKPKEQMESCFTKSRNDFNSFSEQISLMLDTTISSEMNSPENTTVQLAMYLELYHRILNLHSIVRFTVKIGTTIGRESLLDLEHSYLRRIINDMCDNTKVLRSFLPFIHRWLFIWGGCILKSKEETEYRLLAEECGISVKTVKLFISFIRRVYRGADTSMIYENDEKLFFKYIPAPFRGLGKIHRCSYNEYEDITLFNEDEKNIELLEKCLTSSGGVENLKF